MDVTKIKDAAVGKAKEAAENLFNFPRIDSDLTVWFVFDGKEYELSQFNIRFEQWVDFKGQPQNEVRGGSILLTMTQTVPDNIYKWAMTSCLRDGAVEFRSQTANSPLKVSFNNGYCIDFRRNVDGFTGIETILTISAEYININGIDLDNHWV